MVEIFKTNITDGAQAGLVLQLLTAQWPEYQANFDLEDCDKILRVDSAFVECGKIAYLLHAHGYECELLH